MRYLIPCGAHRFGSWRPAQLMTYDILFISTNSPSVAGFSVGDEDAVLDARRHPGGLPSAG